MKFPGINFDLQDIRGQLLDLRERVNLLHFRKPWTTRRETSPIAYVALGILVAAVIGLLFKYRHHCEAWCRNCLAPKPPHDPGDSGLEERAAAETDPV
jgi:hypothetical protein